jgi:abortive infection bacteriophage resistance protein
MRFNRELKLVLAMMLLSTLIMAAAVQPTYAVIIEPGDEDLTPPVLTGLSINPVSIDTDASPQDVTFTFSITDDLSGFEHATFFIRSPSSSQAHYGYVTLDHLVEGNPLDGVYDFVIEIPQNSEAGTWHIQRVCLFDDVTNTICHYESDIISMGYDTEFLVVGATDLVAPELTGLGINPASIEVSDTSVDVVFTFDIFDEVSGFDHATFYIRSPSGQAQYGNVKLLHLVSGDENIGTYEFTINVPQYSEVGIWYIPRICLFDQVGNTICLYESDLNILGFPTEIEVIADPFDLAHPVLVDINIDPPSVETSAGPKEVTFIFSVTDELSGFEHASFFIRSPSGQQGHFGYVTVSQHIVSGNPLDGVYEFIIVMPQYSEVGTWRIGRICLFDETTNTICYYYDDLVEMPVDSGFEVYEGISATIDIDPDTLNLKSNGEWITAYIELPDGYDVNDISIESIELEIEGHAFVVDLEAPSAVDDYDSDGIPDLMVKFDRSDIVLALGVTDIISEPGDGDPTEFKITGIVGAITFEGSDWIVVIRPGK